MEMFYPRPSNGGPAGKGVREADWDRRRSKTPLPRRSGRVSLERWRARESKTRLRGRPKQDARGDRLFRECAAHLETGRTRRRIPARRSERKLREARDFQVRRANRKYN